jgi:hypothetical protein
MGASLNGMWKFCWAEVKPLLPFMRSADGAGASPLCKAVASAQGVPKWERHVMPAIAWAALTGLDQLCNWISSRVLQDCLAP